MRLIWFLVGELHIECEILGTTLVMVKGNVLGKIEAIGTNKKEFLVTVVARSATAQEFTAFEDDNGTLVRTQLLSATSEGTFKESGESAGADQLFTELATELQN